jgi:predicted transcriptional regulator
MTDRRKVCLSASCLVTPVRKSDMKTGGQRCWEVGINTQQAGIRQAAKRRGRQADIEQGLAGWQRVGSGSGMDQLQAGRHIEQDGQASIDHWQASRHGGGAGRPAQ